MSVFDPLRTLAILILVLPLRRGPAIPAEHRLYFDDGAEQDDRQYAGHKSLVNGVVAARGYRKEVNWMTRNFPGQPHNENKLGIAGRDSASLPAPAAQESNAMTSLDPRIAAVTDRIIERSKLTRRGYLDLMAEQANRGITRPRLSCGNFAHWFAVAGQAKDDIRATRGPNPAVVTSFNDMLSAHQPCERYPAQIKIFARQVGATAQVAGGVPAMCDGVTQGQAGMDLALFSRDVIALSTAVALSNGIFDGVAMLGICDKIVPGLLIGAPRFGHLQTLLNAREPAKAPPPATGTGRELFAFMRATADDAEHGGSAMLHAMEEML